MHQGGTDERRIRLRGAVEAAAALTIAAGALATLATLVAPGAWPICLATPYLLHWGLLGLCGAALYVLAARRRSGAAFCAWLVAGTAVAAWPAAVELAGCGHRVPALPRASAGGGGATLVVLVCNVYSGNRDHGAVLRLIEEADADIVLLLELTTPWLAALRGIERRYPFHTTQPDDGGNFGIGVWSRHAFARGGIVRPEDTGGGRHVPQIEIELRVPADGGERLVRFFGVHPLAPIRQGLAAERDRLLDWVAERCLAIPDLPTLVAGDFNASCWCAAARRLAERAGLADATARLHRTWPTGLRGLILATRIDHVWAGRGWNVIEARRGAFVGSDHFPVLARLRLVGR